MDISKRSIELYVSWINGNREYVMDEIAACDATMTLMAEICLKFQANSDLDLKHFLTHIATYA